MIPELLKKEIEDQAARFSLKVLIEGQKNISDKYRQKGSTSLDLTDLERCVYLISRLPATYGVVGHLLNEWEKRFSHIPIHSFLDIGAGPGSAAWAVAERFPFLKKGSLLEKDTRWIEWGKKLASKHPLLSKAAWLSADIGNCSHDITSADLVVASYSLGELNHASLFKAVEFCWFKTEKALLIIEPGTPERFTKMLTIRDLLLQQGAYLAAPCPHALKCPLVTPAWCHFPARIVRSSLHRQIKEGELPFEDEKFFYLLFTRFQPELPSGRIINTPAKHSGHVEIPLCTSSGVKKSIISKKMKQDYKEARKLIWGDYL